jgi:hypothetical protein
MNIIASVIISSCHRQNSKAEWHKKALQIALDRGVQGIDAPRSFLLIAYPNYFFKED